jgi:saccharopine dehydrogenase (NAD+, L-lysine-forming)
MRRGVRLGRPVLPLLRWKPLQSALERVIERSVTGPSAHDRATRQTQLWGRATDEAGHAVEGTLVTPEGYALTAETAVESTLRLCAAGKTGFLTPSRAFGAGYIAEFDGCDGVSVG